MTIWHTVLYILGAWIAVVILGLVYFSWRDRRKGK